MKILKTWAFAVAASVAFLASGSSVLANANFSNNYDLLMHFQSGNGSENDVVVAGLGDGLASPNQYNSLNFLRDQGLAQTGTYHTLTNINATLTTAYGAGWASLTDLYAGAIGTRGNSAGSGIVANTGLNNANTAGDPRRTLYYTQVRTSNLLPGESQSTSVSFPISGPGDSAFNAVNSGMFGPVQNRFELLSGAAIIGDRTVAATIGQGVGNANPIGGSSYTNLNTVQGSFSTAFSFGAAGSDVVLALDLFRMKPNNTPGGVGEIDPSNPDHQGLFLGNIVLKSTGEVGYLAAVPEPSTYAMLAIGGVFAALAIYRRRKMQSQS